MNYYQVTVGIESVDFSLVDKKGNNISLNLSNYDLTDDLYDTYIPYITLDSYIKVVSEKELDSYIESKKEKSYEKLCNYMQTHILEIIKILHRSLPYKCQIETIIDYNINFYIKKRDMRQLSAKKCLEIMTIEQLVDCFGNVFILK